MVSRALESRYDVTKLIPVAKGYNCSAYSLTSTAMAQYGYGQQQGVYPGGGYPGQPVGGYPGQPVGGYTGQPVGGYPGGYPTAGYAAGQQPPVGYQGYGGKCISVPS